MRFRIWRSSRENKDLFPEKTHTVQLVRECIGCTVNPIQAKFISCTICQLMRKVHYIPQIFIYLARAMPVNVQAAQALLAKSRTKKRADQAVMVSQSQSQLSQHSHGPAIPIQRAVQPPPQSIQPQQQVPSSSPNQGMHPVDPNGDKINGGLNF
jgi:hypothetical protein